MSCAWLHKKPEQVKSKMMNSVIYFLLNDALKECAQLPLVSSFSSTELLLIEEHVAGLFISPKVRG